MSMSWKDWDEIIEGRLYLGNLASVQSPLALFKRGVTHIVSVCAEPIPPERDATFRFAHLRVRVPDVDTADLLVHLPAACAFIADALRGGGVVLVHCVLGLSRSAAVVAAYLMYSRRIGATAALDLVREAREQIWINPGFHEQLVLFELCQYAPSTSCGIYQSWRRRVERYIADGRLDRTR